MKLTECQKEFIFNSRYEFGHLNEDEKLLYLKCAKGSKGVGAYINDITTADYLHIYEDVFKKVLIYCEDCEYQM